MAAFACLAVIATLVVFAGVLWPLWRESRGRVIAVVLALGVSTFALYRIVGTPAALDPATLAAEEAPRNLDEAIAELRAALQRNPDQPEGWRLLGRSLAAREDLAGSREAFARAVALNPDDPDLLVEAAQSRMYADPEHRFDDTALALLRHALEIRPNHQRARWFIGAAQRRDGKPADAAATWEPLLSEVDTDTAASLRAQIDAARAEAGLPPLPTAAATKNSAHTVTVKVALAPDLAARSELPGDTTVFVIARVAGGPPMPVAVEKHRLSELPLSVVLDDADSPMPTQKLSALAEVEVIARLSASGSATRAADDIESPPVRVSLPADKPVQLKIGKSP